MAYARDELNIRANALSLLLPKSSVQKERAYFRELTVCNCHVSTFLWLNLMFIFVDTTLILMLSCVQEEEQEVSSVH